MRGIFRIHTESVKDSNGNPLVLDMGAIQSISDSFIPQIATFQGIPSQPSENAFIMDTGVKREISITFIRVSPVTPINALYGDSALWSNGYWLHNLGRYVVNRWQAETDGIKVSYTQGESGKDNFPDIPLTNCYVKTWSVRYTKGSIQALVGSVTFIVGSTKMSHAISPTVVYQANYSEMVGSSVVNTTNLVKSYESTDGVGVIRYPADWVAYATSEYGITPDRDRVWYCTDTTTSLEDALENDIAYKYQPSIVEEDRGFKGTVDFVGNSTVLYARYIGL